MIKQLLLLLVVVVVFSKGQILFHFLLSFLVVRLGIGPIGCLPSCLFSTLFDLRAFVDQLINMTN